MSILKWLKIWLHKQRGWIEILDVWPWDKEANDGISKLQD
jgi:hypothetical protein